METEYDKALSQIKEKCLTCQKCSLCKTRTNTVFSGGVPNSKLMLIGEAPGENEDKTANTFIKSGNMLYFNKIKLCENVEEFVINVDNSINQSISVSIKILGETYDLQYAIN